MSSVDLNLLTVFDTLFDLRSVTHAAQRLNVTQSAVSHALRRLRDAAGDPLFLRGKGALQPTARAEEMAPGVRAGLAQLRAAMMPVGFDPATAVRTFTLAAGSYFCALIIPKLVARVRAVAPGVSFRIVPVGADLLSQLDEGAVELAVGAFEDVPPRLLVRTLFREELVWIAARDNPIGAERLTRAKLSRYPHLVIATRRAFEPVGALLAERPLEQHRAQPELPADGSAAGSVPAILYDGMTAAAVVACTDAIAMVPRRLAQSEGERLGLRIVETAENGRGIDLGMVVHIRSSADAGIAWVQSLLFELSR